MSRTIEIPDEVYVQLEQQARMRGLTLPKTIAELVHEDEKARMSRWPSRVYGRRECSSLHPAS